MLRNIALHVCAHWNMEEDNSHMFCQLLPGFIYFDKINNYLLFFFCMCRPEEARHGFSSIS